MKTVFTKATLVLALGATAFTVSAPAQAQTYTDHHNHDRAGAAIVAGVAGLAIGAAIASGGDQRRGYTQQYGYQRDSYWANDDWNNGGDSYEEFQREYRHISRGIQLSLNSGSLTRYEATRFYRELQRIQQSAYQSSRYGDYEGDYVQRRLEQLHEQIHEAQEQRYGGSARFGAYYGNQRPGVGYPSGYNPYRR